MAAVPRGPVPGGRLTIIFDAGISSVTFSSLSPATTITTSGDTITDIGTLDGAPYTGTFILNSGYAIDSIVYEPESYGGTLSDYKDDYFIIIAGISGIVGTLTITTKKTMGPKETFISDMNSLSDSINQKAGSTGKKTIKGMKALVDGLKTEFSTQEKSVTPTKSTQSVTPDSGKDGLSKVTVNPIPSEYVIPVYWDGRYTESDGDGSGYTVTLDRGYWSLEYFTPSYSIDGGLTWTQLTYNDFPVTISNVQKIKFNLGDGYYAWWISDENNEDIAYGGSENSETDEIPITRDITLNIGYGTPSGGSG